MILPNLLFSACGNYKWNYSSLCIRQCHLVA